VGEGAKRVTTLLDMAILLDIAILGARLENGGVIARTFALCAFM